MLKLENASKYFGGLHAVQNVTFQISEREIVGLIGPNGAGKTTVFNLISGFLPLSSGRIFFQNEEISKLRPPHRIIRKGIARTFQIPKPFRNASVLDNVMISSFAQTGHKSEARNKALEILKYLGLNEKRENLAGMLTTPELKCLELAKALATNPKFLMLDEVMAGLNQSEVGKMISIIRNIRQQGTTIFLVEHNISAVMKLSDRIIVLHFGEKIAEGNPGEISQNKRVIETYLGEDTSVA
jgi:branched-chain amino acid transport system ATP-binding protein